MFIQVRAINPGFQGAWRAGRFFDATVRRLEVVPDVDVKKPDPRAPYLNGAPSMEQISKAGYEALKADGRFSFMPDGDGDVLASVAGLAAVRAQRDEANAALANAKVRIAELEAQLAAALGGGDDKKATKGGKAKE